MRILLGFFVVGICFVCTLGQLPSQDILALLEFKKGIKHDPTGYVLRSWNDESIDFNGCPSSWNGIMCNGENVAALVLENLGLSGKVDLSVFSNLTMLVKLSLSNNSLSGELPNNIGEFKSLEYLDISNNQFSSSLPSEIGKLVILRNLSLAGNNFSGSLPDTISGITSLHSLDLSRNSLSGPIPESLTRLGGLVYLNLAENGFTKTIPKGFELMTQLDVLDLHGNLLHGEIDPELLPLIAASYVDLSGNMLANSGKEPLKFLEGMSRSLQHLNLSHNRIRGSLFSIAGNQVFDHLKVLDLSHNLLYGELPDFNFIYELEVLKLGNNRFSGSIPNILLEGDSLVVLTELDLSRNNLSGSINMIASTTLKRLNLSSNMLSGELPVLSGSCAVIDLSKNQFGGNLTRLLKWENVEFLDISQNHLTGSIPNITSQFLRLQYLNLSHNNLYGFLPKVVARFPKLVTIDLSFNQLIGPLLVPFLASPSLNELRIQNNILSGEIDFQSLPNVSNLAILDLSNNDFSGHFPDGLESFTRLRMLNLGGNNFSGPLPTSVDNISSLNAFDISRNHFSGPLPETWLDHLQSFNASYNDLSGAVPESLSKFPLSSFYPGNSNLQFPNPSGSRHKRGGNRSKKRLRTIIKMVIIVSCVATVVLLILLSLFIHYKRLSKKRSPNIANKDITCLMNSSNFGGRDRAGGLPVSGDDLVTSRKGGSSAEIINSEEKMTAITDFSPSKTSHLSWSSDSGDSCTVESLSRFDVKSPDRLVGELYFLDDTTSFSAEELSKAPAEVLGRSSHGTSYKATMHNGFRLTVKWLREGVAKQRKEFAKEAKKFANIRHPNVVVLRGYYWGPTQHEKLILSDYISPGSLASFLYDRPGRKGPPLTWAQRLKIAVDVARGLNYLHFDREIPHGNLKATNILLDGPDLNARVGDYCLHRLMTQSGITEQILDAGVLGYRAPELAASKKPQPSFKSDVYAFGVILLELLTGKCAGDVVSSADGGVDLTDWVRMMVAEGQGSVILDAAVAHEMSIPAADKGMKETLGIALRCIRSVAGRPGIKNVYEDLSSI